MLSHDIINFALDAKEQGSTWPEIADLIRTTYGIEIKSVSGLRSRISEYRRYAKYDPVSGVTDSLPASETWGEGLAQLVKPATKEQFETVIFVSDIHAPYHNAVLLASLRDFIKDFDPHRIVINGDTNDFFQLSRWNRTGDRLETLQNEIDMGRDIRGMFRNAAPNAVIDETLGNHDERIITYIDLNAGGLKSLAALKPGKLLGLEEYEINHHPRCGFRLREEFVVEHGHIARSEAGASAKSRLDKTMISGIMGHTHRLAEYNRTGYRNLSWYEMGCLCLKSPDYVVGETNWQPGFAVGHFSTKNPSVFNIQLVKAIADGFIFDGKVYGNVDVESGAGVLV